MPNQYPGRITHLRCRDRTVIKIRQRHGCAHLAAAEPGEELLVQVAADGFVGRVCAEVMELLRVLL